jgi:hydrogenase maturation protease
VNDAAPAGPAKERQVKDRRVLILGIGNLLMGDEGVGVHAARVLEGRELPAPADVVDGGTGGFHLLSYFSDYGTIILIDATKDENPPGTVSLLRPRYPNDFPRALTAHDIGLRDLIESATLLGPLPKMFLVTVSLGEIQAMTATLSPEVQAAVPKAVTMVEEILTGSI